MQTGMRDDRGRNLLRASRSSPSAQCYHAAFSYWAREASNYEIPGNVPMILLPINHDAALRGAEQFDTSTNSHQPLHRLDQLLRVVAHSILKHDFDLFYIANIHGRISFY